MPPGRKSKLDVVVLKPFGPHHCARCSELVQAEKTSSRGASNSRTPMIERASLSRSRLFFTAMFHALGLCFAGLQLLQIIVEAIEAAFEETPVAFEPVVHLFQGARL